MIADRAEDPREADERRRESVGQRGRAVAAGDLHISSRSDAAVKLRLDTEVERIFDALHGVLPLNA